MLHPILVGSPQSHFCAVHKVSLISFPLAS